MLIRNATVLSMDPQVGDFATGDVLIDGDRIVAVGHDLGSVAQGDVIDATGCIVVPGFVDTHRHMWEGVLRGRAADDTLEGYFQRVLLEIGPELTPADLAVGESLSARAALDAGITTVQDTSDINGSPERAEALVAALQDSGLRAVFCYGLSRPYVMDQGTALPPDVRRIRAELLADDDALVTMGLETQNGDDDAERHNAGLARDLGLRTAHHVRSGIRPSRLRDLGALLPGTTFVHGNGLDIGELRVIADAGGSLSIAPVVEMALGLGRPMIAEALAVPDLAVTLSVDVEVTSPTDMFSQMRTLYLVARAASTSGGPTVREILRFATLAGAQALGLGDRTGSITPGKQADLLVLRADGVGVAPVADPYGTVVLQCDRAHVDTVLVAGTVHKRAGRLVRDDAALLDRAQATVRRLAKAGVLRTADRPAQRGPDRPADRSPIVDEVEASMGTANAKVGPRTVPAREIPVPTTVSPDMQAVIRSPYRTPAWNLRPQTAEEWQGEAARLAAPVVATLPELRRLHGVVSEPTTFGGVPGWWVRPAEPTAGRRLRRLLHVHGGGFVYAPGEAGTVEAILMAGIGGFEVASIDYRLAHKAPFPAALDDVTEAWTSLLQTRPASQMAVFGTSVGGALTLSLALRCARDGIPVPAALGVLTPWSDLTETGDTYKTNEWLDNVEVSYRGFLTQAARLYARGRDLADPLLSPVHGDFRGAPATILLSGTRDLFLSNTVRVHRAMRTAGVNAQLHVFEGQSHAQYLHALGSPETREVYGEIAAFFNGYLVNDEH